jgi:hypothetical protein
MADQQAPPDWVALSPELKKQWSDDTDWQFILGVSGTIELALLYGELFSPTFVVCDRMVFTHRDKIEQSAQQWMANTSNDRMESREGTQPPAHIRNPRNR